jgi:hypothetical protein
LGVERQLEEKGAATPHAIRRKANPSLLEEMQKRHR